MRQGMDGTKRTPDKEPPPHERLPPRKRRPESSRTTPPLPEPHRQRNAKEAVDRCGVAQRMPTSVMEKEHGELASGPGCSLIFNVICHRRWWF